ncbi:MAG: hypothetical protein QG575_798 [Euryarchaeota archaeon]|nr:hypothetical protein [Euryarchaeota archaeon]
MLWILKNQLGRRNLNDYQFSLLVGQEYELQKKVSRGGGDRKSERAIENQSGKNYHIDPEKTSEKIVKEHNISEKTVRNSADLFRSHQAVKEFAPEVAIFSMLIVKNSKSI